MPHCEKATLVSRGSRLMSRQLIAAAGGGCECSLTEKTALEAGCKLQHKH
jgi:hypothetical protein